MHFSIESIQSKPIIYATHLSQMYHNNLTKQIISVR